MTLANELTFEWIVSNNYEWAHATKITRTKKKFGGQPSFCEFVHRKCYELSSINWFCVPPFLLFSEYEVCKMHVHNILWHFTVHCLPSLKLITKIFFPRRALLCTLLAYHSKQCRLCDVQKTHQMKFFSSSLLRLSPTPVSSLFLDTQNLNVYCVFTPTEG